MKKYGLLTILLSLFTVSLMAKEYLVSNMLQYQSLPQLQAGDVVVLENGVWKDVVMIFKGVGTAEAPVVLRPMTPGKVTIEGVSKLQLEGEYLVVEDLMFRNGYTPNAGVIDFKTQTGVANHTILQRCVIDGYSNPDKKQNSYYVQVNGRNNTVRECYFAGKTNKGMTLTVRLDPKTSFETNHHIYRNYFGYRPALGENGGETIQIGLAETSLLNSWTYVEENYFEHCDGEIEIISSKSCENFIFNNVFAECKGMVTLRHGHRTKVYGNLFLGNGIEGTGGVRVVNESHQVFNNFFYKLRGRGVNSALVLVNGIPNALPKEYMQIKNAAIVSNTFYDCSLPWHFGQGYGPNRNLPPINTVLLNNIVYSPSESKLVEVYDKTDGIFMKSNIMVDRNGVLSDGDKTDAKVQIRKMGTFEVPYVEGLPIGALPNLSLLDKSKYGPSWYKINNK